MRALQNSSARIALCCLPLLAGCQLGMPARDAVFSQVSTEVRQPVARINVDSGAQPWVGPAVQAESTQVEYVAMALARHPKVQAARWAVDAAAWQVPVAASLEDPKLNVAALPAPIETAAGRQSVSVGISQKTPIPQKQTRKAAIASAAASEAQARLAATEREVIAHVRDVFADLLFRQQTIGILNDERELLAEVTEIVVALYKTDKVSQQDIAQAELAQLQVEQDLIAARQQLRSAQTSMARLLQLAPQTQLVAKSDPCLERLASDVDALLQQAVASRPELHALIAKADQDRMSASLARLDYVPDPTFGAAWIGIENAGISPIDTGDDAVLLNMSMNLPVRRKRIAAKIRSAEAKAISSARAYDDLRDETLRVVYDEYTRLDSKRELIELLQSEVIPKANETLEVAVKAYGVAKTDIQQVLENWRKLIRYDLSMRQLEMEYRKSLASLERAVGTNVATSQSCDLSRLPPAPTLPENDVADDEANRTTILHSGF